MPILCHNLAYMKNCSMIFIMRYKPVVFLKSATPCSAVSFVTWIPCTNFLAIRQPRWSFHEPESSIRNFWSIFIFRNFSFLATGVFCYKISQVVVWKVFPQGTFGRIFISIFVKCCNHSSLYVIWHLLVKTSQSH